MDFSVYREFVCLANELNFTAAASRCYITQSTLSKHICSLESELGVRLFVRNKKSVRLTEIGQEFAAAMQVMINDYDAALRQVNLSKEKKSGVLSIGFLAAASRSFLRIACERFGGDFPNVELVLHTMEGKSLYDSLSNNEIDVAICMLLNDYNKEWYSVYEIFDDYYGVVVPKGSLLAGRHFVTASDLERGVIIPNHEKFPAEHDRIKYELAQAVPSLSVYDTVNDAIDYNILPMVDSRPAVLLSHLSYQLDEESLRFIPISDPHINVKICAMWKSRKATPIVIGFINALSCVTSAMSIDVLRNTVRF